MKTIIRALLGASLLMPLASQPALAAGVGQQGDEPGERPHGGPRGDRDRDASRPAPAPRSEEADRGAKFRDREDAGERADRARDTAAEVGTDGSIRFGRRGGEEARPGGGDDRTGFRRDPDGGRPTRGERPGAGDVWRGTPPPGTDRGDRQDRPGRGAFDRPEAPRPDDRADAGRLHRGGDGRGTDRREPDRRGFDDRNGSSRDGRDREDRYRSGWDRDGSDRGGWSGAGWRGDRNDGPAHADRGAWNRGWRSDNRYDWNRYRYGNRGAFRLPRYYAPATWRYGYRRFSVGVTLSALLWGRDYWIDDPYAYRLPPAYGPYRWVRYYDDALLIDLRSGRVVDVVYDIFW